MLDVSTSIPCWMARMDGRTVLSARRGIFRESARMIKDCRPIEQEDEFGVPKKIKSSRMCDMM